MIALVQGDITQLQVDVIVNAANRQLKRGGGVDGAIHRAAGPWLQKELNTIGWCEPGDAVSTRGFNLLAKRIIHTAGPVWQGGHKREADTLRSCYRKCLGLFHQEAQANGFNSIAFPAISTGVYGFPPDKAAGIAIEEVTQWFKEQDPLMQVYFVAYDAATFKVYDSILRMA